MIYQEPHATNKEHEQEEIMQQINALQRKLTHTSSAVKTQSGIDMLSVKQKLSSSKKRP
jgi:hypothetical protein